MRLAQLIKTRKGGIDLGKWNEGNIPRSAFPMSNARAKAYKYGKEYKWRVIKFTCRGNKYRVFILLKEGKEIYRATLALEDPSGLKVMCQHEYHASEPGWHCHMSVAEGRDIPTGSVRSHLARWPKRSSRRESFDFGVNEGSAIGVAAKRFGFTEHGPEAQEDLGL